MDGGRRPGGAMGDHDGAAKSTWKVDVQLRPAPLDRELQRRDQLVESGDAPIRVPLLGSGILGLESSIGRPELPRCVSASAQRITRGACPGFRAISFLGIRV